MTEGRPALRLALVLVSTMVLQVAVANRVRILDVAPDLPLLMALAAGIAGGRDRGAVVGFFAGLCYDLLATTPFGLAALSYCIAGFVVGELESTALRSSWWMPIVGWLGGSALGIGLFAVIGSVLDEVDLTDSHLPATIGIVAGWNAILGPAALRVMRWVDHDRGPLRSASW